MVDSMFTTAFREIVSGVIAMRKGAGLTQRQLAAAVGREHNYIARIETGQRRVDLVELVQLCRACNIDPEQLIPEITHKIVSLLPRKRSATPTSRPPIVKKKRGT
jgi:transcriptional regulator with XRE-family HTH domain